MKLRKMFFRQAEIDIAFSIKTAPMKEGDQPVYVLTKQELEQVFREAREGMLIDDNLKLLTFNEWLLEMEKEG